MTTHIQNLSFEQTKETNTDDISIPENIEIDNLSKIIMDLEENQEKRVKAFNMFIKRSNTVYRTDQVSEITSKLFTMFQISNSRIIKDYLLVLITKSDLPNVIKATIAFNLCDFDIEDEECFETLNTFLGDYENIVLRLTFYVSLKTKYQHLNM